VSIIADRQKLLKAQVRVSTVNVGTTSTALLKADPNRIGWIVGPPVTDDFTISFGTSAALGLGLHMHATGLPLKIGFGADLMLATLPVYAISDTNAQDIQVTELVLIG
jgi:hypothetical protein